MQNLKLVLLFIALLLVAGCNSIGPTTITRDRFDYSGALAESWKNQMLLNLVKMRYLDLPIYLEVGQIVSGYSVETSASAAGEFGDVDAGTNFFGLGATRKFTDRPTITYTPLTGNRFLESFLTPIDPAEVFSLLQAGFDADFILSLSVDSLNGLRNRPAKLGAEHKADEDFFRALALFHDIQDAGAVGVRVEGRGKADSRTIVFFRRDRIHPQVLAKIEEVRTLLHLTPGRFEYHLVESPLRGDTDELAVATRSLLQLMTALAMGVEVPPKHLKRRLAPTLPETLPGEAPLLQVHSGSTKPEDAFVAVSYEGEWFWVANDDWKSKRTFSSILFLFTLTDASGRGLPVLTIPTQ